MQKWILNSEEKRISEDVDKCLEGHANVALMCLKVKIQTKIKKYACTWFAKNECKRFLFYYDQILLRMRVSLIVKV